MTASPSDSGTAIPAVPIAPSIPVVSAVEKYDPAAAYARVQVAIRDTGHVNANATISDPAAMRRVLAHEVSEREKRDNGMSSDCNRAFMAFDNLELYAALQHAKTLAPEVSLAATTAPLSSTPPASAIPVPTAVRASTAANVPVLQPNGRPAGARYVALNNVVRGTTPALLRADGIVVAVVPYGLNRSGLRRQRATKTGTTTGGRPYYTIDPTRPGSRHSSPIDWFTRVSLRGVITALISVVVAFILLLIFQPQVWFAHFVPRDRGLAATAIVIFFLWIVWFFAYKAGKKRDLDYDNI